MKIRAWLVTAGVLLVGVGSLAAISFKELKMGKQPDGGFIVSSGQKIKSPALAFDGRPIDMALHPSGEFFAILNQNEVFLATSQGILPDTTVKLTAGAGFRGAIWTPEGGRLFVSISDGIVQELIQKDRKLTAGRKIEIKPAGDPDNPRPGGMALTKDGKTLFVAAMDRNSIAEVDVETGKFVREFPTGQFPFEVKLANEDKTLIVSNWGGRTPEPEDETGASGNSAIVIDPLGGAASGTLTFIDRQSGKTSHLKVGLHPCSIVISGNTGYVANAASDSISIFDIDAATVTRTIPLKWGKMNLLGSMPVALALNEKENTLYACNGGDNALCEIDLTLGYVKGFRPAGYYPVSIALSPELKIAYVLNTKGNGSVRKSVKGMPGNSHDFQGSVSVLNLTDDLEKATAEVALNNGWNRDRTELRPNLGVYNGKIKHVLYIIKENRTYDQVFGDMPQGNGDPKLCDLGLKVTPNQHAIADQFTLFDNAYVSGTNSADGHNWSTQAEANDYLEHFYTGYRTYPDDGDCAMTLTPTGCLWDAALKKGRTFRDYGEFCDDELAVFTPTVTSWMEVWKDRQSGKHKIRTQVNTRLKTLRPYINSQSVYWPLLQSDQQRADIFIGEYRRFSRENRVPELMILSLPSDHTEGRDPRYPKPQSMVADNDLAVGRVVEAISHSKQWKDYCIFIIEDDAQSGYDHVDGHRTVYSAISPYTRRKFVDHTMYTTLSMLKSIELMLGIDPMNRFDALTPPLTTCFTETPDLTPFDAVPNTTMIGDMNPPTSAQNAAEKRWTKISLALDWSGPDRADPVTLNRVLWHTLHGVDTPYPREEGR